MPVPMSVHTSHSRPCRLCPLPARPAPPAAPTALAQTGTLWGRWQISIRPCPTRFCASCQPVRMDSSTLPSTGRVKGYVFPAAGLFSFPFPACAQ